MVEPDFKLSSSKKDASTVDNDVGYKSVGICGLYVCDFVCYYISMHQFTFAKKFTIRCAFLFFTVSLTAYGGPLSSSLLRDFHLLSVHGLHSPWLVHHHSPYGFIFTSKSFILFLKKNSSQKPF